MTLLQRVSGHTHSFGSVLCSAHRSGPGCGRSCHGRLAGMVCVQLRSIPVCLRALSQTATDERHHQRTVGVRVCMCACRHTAHLNPAPSHSGILRC